jgi:8-oxo-dGTP diphosphatase
MSETVRAAGGAVWRRVAGGVEVLVVHRPRYDDWSLPKGKCDLGEADDECARREVREETGLECELGEELPGASYHDRHGRPKTVRYWAMTPRPDATSTFEPGDEVDRIEWLGAPDASRRLSYDRDQQILSALMQAVAGDG